MKTESLFRTVRLSVVIWSGLLTLTLTFNTKVHVFVSLTQLEKRRFVASSLPRSIVAFWSPCPIRCGIVLCPTAFCPLGVCRKQCSSASLPAIRPRKRYLWKESSPKPGLDFRAQNGKRPSSPIQEKSWTFSFGPKMALRWSCRLGKPWWRWPTTSSPLPPLLRQQQGKVE